MKTPRRTAWCLLSKSTVRGSERDSETGRDSGNQDSGNYAIQETNRLRKPIQETAIQETRRFRKTRDSGNRKRAQGGGGGCWGGAGWGDNIHVRALQFPESAGFRIRAPQFPESAGFRIRALQFPESVGLPNPGFPNPPFSFRIRVFQFAE